MVRGPINILEDLLNRGKDGKEQSTPSVQINDQSMPQQPPYQEQPQSPYAIVLAEYAEFERMINQVKSWNAVQRAVFMYNMGFPEALRQLKPEDWAVLIEKLGTTFAEAFRKWAEVTCSCQQGDR